MANENMDEWRKMMSELSFSHLPPPHRSNQKYLFNQSSGCVFLGNKYIGQGQIAGTSLMVTQYKPISANKFIITHLN